MFVFCETCCQRGFDVANDEKVIIIGLVPEERLRDLYHGRSVKKQNVFQMDYIWKALDNFEGYQTTLSMTHLSVHSHWKLITKLRQVFVEIDINPVSIFCISTAFQISWTCMNFELILHKLDNIESMMLW